MGTGSSNQPSDHGLKGLDLAAEKPPKYNIEGEIVGLCYEFVSAMIRLAVVPKKV